MQPSETSTPSFSLQVRFTLEKHPKGKSLGRRTRWIEKSEVVKSNAPDGATGRPSRLVGAAKLPEKLRHRRMEGCEETAGVMSTSPRAGLTHIKPGPAQQGGGRWSSAKEDGRSEFQIRYEYWIEVGQPGIRCHRRPRGDDVQYPWERTRPGK